MIDYDKLRAIVRDMGARESDAASGWLAYADKARAAGDPTRAVADLIRAAWHYGCEAGKTAHELDG